METVEIKPEKRPQPHKHGLHGIFIGILITIAIVEAITGGFLYLRYQEKEDDLKEKEEMLFRQAMSIEFKQVGLKNTEKDLDILDAELNSYSTELKNKEDQLREQRELLEGFRAAIKDTIKLLEPKKIAEEMMQKYLEKYASVELSKPMPCTPKERALYNAAKVHLDALLTAGLEVSANNKFTQFVLERKKYMNLEDVDCSEDSINTINTDLIDDEELDSEDEYDEESDEDFEE